MKPKPKFSTHDWNFDNVPDNELVACCYWEYARESAFIRDLKNRCASQKWLKMTNSQNWQYVGRDLKIIQSIGPAAEVFLSGFFFAPGTVCQSDDEKAPNFRHRDAPPISGDFPLPWQSLSETERGYRAACLRPDREDPRSQPFSRGYPFMAEWITQHCEATRCAVLSHFPGSGSYPANSAAFPGLTRISCPCFTGRQDDKSSIFRFASR